MKLTRVFGCGLLPPTVVLSVRGPGNRPPEIPHRGSGVARNLRPHAEGDPWRTPIPDLLPIYLNDHLAGATVGVELARRTAGSNRDDELFGPPLRRICEEIEADRATLEQVMEALGARRDRIKPAAAWIAEKLGRLKPNGQLRGYSPLSRMVELEGLYIGISGKSRLWKALDTTVAAQVPEVDFTALGERADRQRTEVEGLQEEAAKLAFG